MSKSLDPDQARFVTPDLGTNCLQRLSADDTSWQSKTPAKWSRTVLECSKIILEFSRTMF